MDVQYEDPVHNFPPYPLPTLNWEQLNLLLSFPSKYIKQANYTFFNRSARLNHAQQN